MYYSRYPSDWTIIIFVAYSLKKSHLDRVVRVGYPPKHLKTHFWFSRSDCPTRYCNLSSTYNRILLNSWGKDSGSWELWVWDGLCVWVGLVMFKNGQDP